MATKDEAMKAGEGAKEQALSEEETEAIFSGPAVYSNRIFVTVNPLGARITFTEQREGTRQPIFRTAAFLNIFDTIALRDLLTLQIERLGVSVEEAKDEPTA